MTALDACPGCSMAVRDHDDDGLELDDGQRWHKSCRRIVAIAGISAVRAAPFSVTTIAEFRAAVGAERAARLLGDEPPGIIPAVSFFVELVDRLEAVERRLRRL
jgi:hypothetical protein